MYVCMYVCIYYYYLYYQLAWKWFTFCKQFNFCILEEFWCLALNKKKIIIIIVNYYFYYLFVLFFIFFTLFYFIIWCNDMKYIKKYHKAVHLELFSVVSNPARLNALFTQTRFQYDLNRNLRPFRGSIMLISSRLHLSSGGYSKNTVDGKPIFYNL